MTSIYPESDYSNIYNLDNEWHHFIEQSEFLKARLDHYFSVIATIAANANMKLRVTSFDWSIVLPRCEKTPANGEIEIIFKLEDEKVKTTYSMDKKARAHFKKFFDKF